MDVQGRSSVVIDCEVRPQVFRPTAGAERSETGAPVRHGIVQDWDALERLDLHAFPGDQPLILVEPAQIGQEDAEQLAELAFEGLDVPRLCLANAAQLALYADYAARQGAAEGHAPGGSLTGLVVESGDSLTTVTPIVDGFIISSGVRCSPLAGARVTCELQSLLRRHRAAGPLTWARCKQLKEEQVCARPMHGGDEGGSSTLEDAWQAAEVLFRPSSGTRKDSGHGLAGIIEDAVQACPIDARKALFGNIVLGGGNALLKGLPARLEAELSALLSQRLGPKARPVPVRVSVHPRLARHAVWLGGSVLGASDGEAYQESGRAAVEQASLTLRIS
ncbi:hypothetical protein QBZ16_000928 [Prototheca wickerhamii]|uniref:Uncharacterized protein n=1 Tax=Prototheca wickerhamii TaxID=3111 RepID=A0AAD9IE61_PROWI|nr:hypothetical protein QBZ16_000928 [Prototheca wickerhamii]